MTNRTTNSRRNRIKRLAAASIAAVGLTISAAPAQSQDIGKAIADSITGGANAASPALQTNPIPGNGTPQSAVDRGLNRAVQGALQGQAPRDAIRNGLGEAAQSSVETPMQTQIRDQDQQFQNQQIRQGSVTGQPLQRDAQGRTFYQDASGQIVFTGQNGQFNTQQGQYYGAQFQPSERGVGIQSVQQNSFAGRAGLKQGDVVLSVNGQPVSDQSGFVQTMNQIQPNQTAKMTVLRDGKEVVITTTTSQTYGQDQHARPEANDDSINKQLDEMRKQIKELQSEVKSLKSKVEENHGK